MRRLAAMVLFLAWAALPGVAWPWGSLTHFRGGQDLCLYLPEEVNPGIFLRAAVGPDLAWTPLFSASHRTYIHSFAFADCLLQVACASLSAPDYRATALAWGVHLAMDEVAHSQFVPQNEVLHTLVELAVDTSIFYHGSPLGWQPLPRYRVQADAISPALLAAASRLYRDLYDPGASLIEPWMVTTALSTLDGMVGKEFQYVRSQGNAQGADRFLQNLALMGLLPGSWEDYYLLALDAGRDWLEGHHCAQTLQAGLAMAPIPLPSPLLLLGSGLLGLGACRRLWAK